MLLENTYLKQQKFVQLCLDSSLPIDEVKQADRLAHYRRLIFTVFEDSLSTAFPITKSVLKAHVWDKMVLEFISNNRHSSPELWSMPKELIDFVQDFGFEKTNNLPFLVDLLEFEWAETEMYCQEDYSQMEILQSAIEIEGQHFVFGPYYKLVSSNYSIHKRDLENECISFYLVYRTQGNSVRYLFINPIQAVFVSNMGMFRDLGVDESLEAMSLNYGSAFDSVKLKEFWNEFIEFSKYTEILVKI